jgi:hypothetical protein
MAQWINLAQVSESTRRGWRVIQFEGTEIVAFNLEDP